MIELKAQSSVIVPNAASQSYAGACNNCRFVLPPLNKAAPVFFERGAVTCSNCNSEVNLWQAALANLGTVYKGAGVQEKERMLVKVIDEHDVAVEIANL
jgi:hypothetical protein